MINKITRDKIEKLLEEYRCASEGNERALYEIAVAETVIVGSVPETYTYFSTTPDELEDTARDNIMNKG